ncbi:hypothetical protein TNCV_4645951 [Trichonephila clavipes]|nr:hypothetical protein TNCV_4645951 [Trichonephila clavipes]
MGNISSKGTEMCNRKPGRACVDVDRLVYDLSSPSHSFFTKGDLVWTAEGLHTKKSIPVLILWCHFYKDMELIFQGSTVLPVLLGSARTPSPNASPTGQHFVNANPD